MKTSKTYRMSENALGHINIIKKKTGEKTDTKVIEKALHLYNLILIGATEECFLSEQTKESFKNMLNLLD